MSNLEGVPVLEVARDFAGVPDLEALALIGVAFFETSALRLTCSGKTRSSSLY